MINGHGDDIYDYAEIKVNFSSNVYAHFPQEGLLDHLTQSLPSVTNYPEPKPRRLEQALAHYWGISSDALLATNGATQAIYQIAQTFKDSCSAIWMPTFPEYEDACRMNGHTVYGFRALADVPASVQVVWICNPNNPTGCVVPKEDLEKCILSHPHTIFIIDGSYAGFTQKATLSPMEVVAFPNVVLLRSMTKDYAIPGLRLGYIVASTPLIEKIAAFSLPWSVNQLAIEAGLYLVAHAEDYRLDLGGMRREAERMSCALSDLGIEVFPSDSHILLCRMPQGQACDLKHYLASVHQLLIRDAANFKGLDASYFRIAVQSPQEDDMLLNALSEWNRR